METIDYNKYLEGLGQVQTSQLEIIKKYCEEQCEKDEALKALYRPEKIGDCYNFIKNAVEKMPRQGNCAWFDDGIVFKMARDYFLEILPTVASEPPEVSSATSAMSHQAEEGGEPVENSTAETAAEAETEPVETENKLADNENEPENENVNEAVSVAQPAQSGGTVTDEYGFEVFGETEEETKDTETAETAETKAETEPEVTESLPADNENLGTPCEEAEPENEKSAEESSTIKYDEEGNGLLFGF